MDAKKSRDAAIAFLGYVEKKGLMSPATAQARRVAVSRVLAILDEHEAHDVLSINLDQVMNRFQNLQGRDFTPESLRTYRSRVKSALADFASYTENPLAFRPSVQGREKKAGPARRTGLEGPIVAREAKTEQVRTSAVSVEGPLGASIIPIPIRADLTVYIQGLPFNLSEAEAKKISGVVTAMAISS